MEVVLLHVFSCVAVMHPRTSQGEVLVVRGLSFFPHCVTRHEDALIRVFTDGTPFLTMILHARHTIPTIRLTLVATFYHVGTECYNY